MRQLLATICFIPILGVAQTSAPLDFPADAESVSAEELAKRLVSNSYFVQPFSGPNWRLQFAADGYAFIDVANGARDEGRWRIEDDKLCIDWGRLSGGCSEVRVQGGTIYIKRSRHGEVVMLASQ